MRVQARANIFGLTYGQTGDVAPGEEVNRALAMGFVVEVDGAGNPVGGAAPLASPTQVGGCGCGK